MTNAESGIIAVTRPEYGFRIAGRIARFELAGEAIGLANHKRILKVFRSPAISVVLLIGIYLGSYGVLRVSNVIVRMTSAMGGQEVLPSYELSLSTRNGLIAIYRPLMVAELVVWWKCINGIEPWDSSGP